MLSWTRPFVACVCLRFKLSLGSEIFFSYCIYWISCRYYLGKLQEFLLSNPTFIGFIALPETPRRYHADECSARSLNRKCLGECESAIVCSVNNLKRSFNIHISCFDTQKTYHHDCWSLKNLFYPVSLFWVRPGCLHINNLNCLRNMERKKKIFSNHPIWNLLRQSFQDGPFSNLNCSQKKKFY